MSQIRFEASSEEIEKLEAFKKAFGIRSVTQALRTLIFLSDSIKVIVPEAKIKEGGN